MKNIRSNNYATRNASISKLFNLPHDEPRLNQFYHAKINGLLAKFGDDSDIEVEDYAIKSIEQAQSILRRENPPKGSNSRFAIEELIMDARDTLTVRCPDVDLPADIMATVRSSYYDYLPGEDEPEIESEDEYDDDEFSDEDVSGIRSECDQRKFDNEQHIGNDDKRTFENGQEVDNSFQRNEIDNGSGNCDQLNNDKSFADSESSRDQLNLDNGDVDESNAADNSNLSSGKSLAYRESILDMSV